MPTRPASGGGLLLATLAAALWGLAPVATKGALEGFTPETVGVVRLATSTALFAWLGGAGRRWWPGDRWSALAGVALGADFVLYNYGIRLTTAAHAGLVINVEVVVTVLMARWLLGERLTARRLAGGGITLAGVGVVLSDRGDVGLGDGRLAGNLLIMTAAVAWSVFAVAQCRVPRADNIFQLLTPIFTVATLTTVPTLLGTGAWRNPGGTDATVMLAVVTLLSTVAVYGIYGRCQEIVDVSVLAIVLASIPVFSVAFAHALLGEAVSRHALVGGTIVLAGVLVIATEGRLA